MFAGCPPRIAAFDATGPFRRGLSRKVVRCWAAAVALLAVPTPAYADSLDAVSVDDRARLAVAACAYPPSEAPVLDPDNPQFNPKAAAGYLETNQDGNYGSSTTQDRIEIAYSLLRYPDAQEAAAALNSWQQSGDPTKPLDWGGSFPVSWRGQGLLGIGMAGGGIVARGQSGRWHFQVSARGSVFDANASAGEMASAIKAMQTLAENAKRYRLFPRELTVKYQVAKQAPRRLGAGEKFQLPLSPEGEARATFSLQVLDGARPVENVGYKVKLSGALAPLAELEQNGSRLHRAFAEAQSSNGEPITLTWIFPPAISKKLETIIDRGDLSLTLAVEARPAPTVLP